MATDKNLDKLIVNKLTMAQYQSATPSDEELYFVTDEAEGFPSQATGDAGKALLAVGDGSVEWGSVASLASANEWTGSNTFKNNQTIASTYYLNCDTINSSSTGNSMLRMYYDTDGAYKVLVGTVYRQATILGSTDRPYYAKDGEAFQAHELALKSDVPSLADKTMTLYKHHVIITGSGWVAQADIYAPWATQITSGGALSSYGSFIATGSGTINSVTAIVCGISATASSLTAVYYDLTNSMPNANYTFTSGYSISDSVTAMGSITYKANA